MLAITTICSLLFATLMAVIAWRVACAERRRSDARVEALAVAIRANPYAESEKDSRPLFAKSANDSRPLFGIMATCLLVVGSGAALAVLASAPRSATAPAAPAAPLELRELTSERTDNQLVIKGVVRNPSSSAIAGLTAVVTLFNHQGGVSASVRAVVDGALLSPGAQSPFAVRVPAAVDVEKYRVSFRTSVPEDRVLPHVDRRDTRGSS